MSRRRAVPAHRLRILAGIALLLVAGGLADRAGAARPTPAPAARPDPAAAPTGALSGSWFCPPAEGGKVMVADFGPAPVTGTVAALPAATPAPLTVTPGTATGVAVGASPSIANIDGGAVAVSLRSDGPIGRIIAPCATAAAPQWYFPAGATYVNADEVITVMNPFPAPTVVDLSFVTDQGPEQPQDFQGVTVPARAAVSLDLRTHLRRRSFIAATLTARTGAVVGWETYVVDRPRPGEPVIGTKAAAAPLADPALPQPGAVVVLGAPALSEAWSWPDGLAGDGLAEAYVVYNPGGSTAQLRLSVGLASGSAEPLPLSVGPFSVLTVVSEQQPRIPPGVAHSATLVSTNGVPVVAARTVAASGARSGVGVLLGGTVAARTWLVGDPGTDRTHTGAVVVYDPGPAPASVSVAGGPGAVVGAGARLALPVGPGAGPFEVTSTEPLFVEYDVYGARGVPGLSLGLAVPQPQP
jgi:hypothetical protein